MIGRRLFQLIIHALLCVICLGFSAAIFSDWRITSKDIAFSAFLFVCALLLSASVWWNWLLLKSQSWHVQLPKTLPRHFILIPTSVLMVYFAGQLRFNYDDHLSFHILSLNLPRFFVISEASDFRVPLAHTAEGIYMFLIYILVFSFLHMLHTLGFLSSNENLRHAHTRGALHWSQLALAAIMLCFVSWTWYRFYTMIEWFIVNALDGDLLNTWNIGSYSFRFISQSLLTWYAVWVMRDAWQQQRQPLKVSLKMQNHL